MRSSGRGRGAGLWLAGVAVVAFIALPACGLDHKKPAPEDDSDFSADRLDMPDDDMVFEALQPEEKDAVERSGMSGVRPPDGAPAEETKSDKAGKVGLSVLSVAMTIGAAVAPFFLF